MGWSKKWAQTIAPRQLIGARIRFSGVVNWRNRMSRIFIWLGGARIIGGSLWDHRDPYVLTEGCITSNEGLGPRRVRSLKPRWAKALCWTKACQARAGQGAPLNWPRGSLELDEGLPRAGRGAPSLLAEGLPRCWPRGSLAAGRGAPSLMAEGIPCYWLMAKGLPCCWPRGSLAAGWWPRGSLELAKGIPRWVAEGLPRCGMMVEARWSRGTLELAKALLAKGLVIPHNFKEFL